MAASVWERIVWDYHASLQKMHVFSQECFWRDLTAVEKAIEKAESWERERRRYGWAVFKWDIDWVKENLRQWKQWTRPCRREWLVVILMNEVWTG